jgi:hypothetical protein
MVTAANGPDAAGVIFVEENDEERSEAKEASPTPDRNIEFQPLIRFDNFWIKCSVSWTMCFENTSFPRPATGRSLARGTITTDGAPEMTSVFDFRRLS